MQRKRISLSGLICVALLLQACGGSDSDSGAANDSTPPSVPAGLTASTQSASSIQLSWQASTDTGSGVAGYSIYRNNGATAIATVTTPGYQDVGLTPSTSYSYTVTAFDGGNPANVSAASTAVTASTTNDTTAPTAPLNLTATSQSVSAIQLTWQASTDTESGVAGYYVYRNGGATPIATATTTNYQDNGLTSATAYSYTVSAFDGATPANVSVASAAASATTASAGGQVGGLDARPSNPSCLAGDAPSTSATLGFERVFPQLIFESPILMTQEPASDARWYVAEQGGKVYKFDNRDDVASASVFIDVTAAIGSATGGEMGLLGMAFHPQWPANPRAYLYYTAMNGGQRVSRIVEYRTQDGGATLASATARTILQVRQPEENHNGGNIMFGPDGFLYAGLGDGGGGGDGHGAIGNGQRLSTLLGKILRIDVNGTTGSTPYAIPAGNPWKYASGTTANAVCNNDTGAWTQNCPEIYAYGLRNPWRWSFDSATGELWVGDVGQNLWEEVDKVVAGGNYGWRCYEGNHDYDGDCGPNAATALQPVIEYDHSVGGTVIGGYVYRGSAMPAMAGRYIFADTGAGRIFDAPGNVTPTLRITGGGLDVGQNVVSFAEDKSHELYFTSLDGVLRRLVATASGGGRQIPALLSATGCVSASDATQPASGLIPFSPNAPFWSDGALKSRWLALPDGQNILANSDGDFDFPNGSVLVKSFRLNSKLIETRLLMRHNDGNWAGYTYEWNAAGTDATRVVGGKTVQKEGQSWRYPSEGQCLTCHTAVAGKTLGLEQAQLNGWLGYPQTGRTANQLFTLNALGMLSPSLAQPVEQLPAMPDPYGSGSLNDRARAWLHTNCSQCHRPGGPTSVDMDLRYTTSLANTRACDVPAANTLGIANGRRIATLASGAGPAARSLVIQRAALTDTNSMPPIQPRIVDAAGVQLLTQWMNSLANCN